MYPITVEGMEARQEKGWEIETRDLTTPSFKLLKQKQRVSEEKERKGVRERKALQREEIDHLAIESE